MRADLKECVMNMVQRIKHPNKSFTVYGEPVEPLAQNT
jgi:aminoglycoside N3'-acetyltransferase